MRGDAILHHLGNSTCVDYISRAIRAGCHSNSYLDELHFDCGNMYQSSILNAEEIFQDETVLALSRHRQGRRLDPVSALRQAEDIFNDSGALLPPENATFRLVWFLGRDRWYYNEVYIRFEYPAPSPLWDYVSWDRSLLLEDLELSEGRFIETEPLLWNYGTVNSCFVCFFFSIQFRILILWCQLNFVIINMSA